MLVTANYDPPVPVTPTFKGVTITLSPDEIPAIVALLRRTGGSAVNSSRRVTQALVAQIQRLGVDNRKFEGSSEVEGHIFFKDRI